MTEDELLKLFKQFEVECLDNPLFQKVLEEVEKEIVDKFKQSEVSAVEAYHEYKAFQRIISKIRGYQITTETIIQKNIN